MSTKISIIRILLVPCLTAFFFASCKKENSVTASSTTATSSTIAVPASASSASASADTVYIVQPCLNGSQRDSIS